MKETFLQRFLNISAFLLIRGKGSKTSESSSLIILLIGNDLYSINFKYLKVI